MKNRRFFLFPKTLFFLRNSLFRHSRFESLHSAGSVNHLIISRIERVAVAADFNSDLFFCRTDGKLVAASASNSRFLKVFWMDF